MIKTIYFTFSLLLLTYLLLPGPALVAQFSPLPNSLKSDEPGDTFQNHNATAYFSDFFRKDAIPFYKKDFLDKFTFLNFSLPFIELNHPPETASLIIRPYQQSYYLEELVHPLRESLYINGWEPFDEAGKRRFSYSHGIVAGGKPFNTKTTLKYFTSPLWARIIVWFGIITTTYLLLHLIEKAKKNV